MNKVTRLLLCLVLWQVAATALADAVNVGLGLERIKRIVERATANKIPDRFPEEWRALSGRLDQLKEALEPLQGRTPSGTAAQNAQNAIDEILRIQEQIRLLDKPLSRKATPPVPKTAPTPIQPQPRASTPTTKAPTASPTPPQATPTRPSAAPVSAPQPEGASPQKIAHLQTALEAARANMLRIKVNPTPEITRAFKDADDLIARTSKQPVPSSELERVLARLRAVVEDPCEEDTGRAYRAKESGDMERAYRFFSELARRQCLDSTITRDAQRFVASYKPAPTTAPVLSPSAPATVRPPPPPAPRVATKEPEHTDSSEPKPMSEPREPNTTSSTPARLALDVWQSAWGDFSEIKDLLAYAKRNYIKSINLNPGHGVTASTMRQSYLELKPIVKRLRSAGIDEINYLYAELNYPISSYVTLLTGNRDLGITTIVDDSEFTDEKKERFEENARTVSGAGLKYSAFITLEDAGNSGVSDATRYWAVENIDEPILMSYFSCSLDEQRDALNKYLTHADARGRAGAVRIAILLGGKSVGRERSCEQQLGSGEFQRFLAGLHGWAKQFRSYGGLVLETNNRLPKYDVAAQPFF